MLINPNIDTFIVKFGWSDSNASYYISVLSMVNPLGGLVGTFVAKYTVGRRRIKVFRLRKGG